MRSELEEGAALIDRTFLKNVFSQDDLADREIADCKFDQCVFSGADFANALFESVTFVDCYFEDCSFAPSDIKGCSFFRVEFNRCSLNESFIDSCTFFESRLLDTQVKTTSVTNCLLWQTDLIAVDPATTSFFHNRFYNGRWEATSFLQASFGYNIVRVSEAVNSPLSAKSALLSMGSAELYSRGDIAGYYDNLLDEAGQSMGQGKKNLIALLRNVASKEISTMAAFDRYLDTYPRSSTDTIRVNREELAFVQLMVDDLAMRDALPGATIITAIQWVQEEIRLFKQKGSEASSYESLPALNNFYMKFMSILETQAKKLEAARIHIEKHEADMIVPIVAKFTVKPELDFSELLNQLALTPSLIPNQKPHLLQSYQGSYYEVLNVSFTSLVALQIYIFMASGIIKQMTQVKMLWGHLTGKGNDDNDKNWLTVKNEVILLPPFLKLPLFEMAKFISSWSFKDDAQLGGLTNLESVEPKVDIQTDETIA